MGEQFPHIFLKKYLKKIFVHDIIYTVNGGEAYV